MTRSARLVPLSLVLPLLLTACPKGDKGAADAGVPDAGPRQLKEKEPNNSKAEALQLTDSSVVSAALAVDPAKPDEDWYALTAPATRTVDVQVSGIPGTDVAFSVHDMDGNLLTTVNSAGDGKPERLPNLGVKGTVLVRVYSAKKGSGGAYTLTATFSEPPAGLEVEPNDRAVDANTLPLGQQVSGYIGHSGDEDWYRIELPTPGGETPGGATPDASAQGAGTTPPAQGTGTTGTPPATGTGAPAPQGTQAPATGAPAPQGTIPETTPAPAVPIGEDGQPTATPVQEPVAAASADAGTPDGGAQAQAPAAEPPGMALKIGLSGVEGVRFEVQVLSEAQAQLFTVKSKDGEGLLLRNIGVRGTDRVVYVVVKSAWVGTGKEAKRGFNPDKSYTLSVTQEEAGSTAELEPNDDMSHATALPLNGYREGFLSPKTDVDYYVLRTPMPVLGKVQLSGVERLDLVLSVVDPGTGDNQPERTLVRVNDGAVKEPEYLNNFYCKDLCWLKVEGAAKKIDGKWTRDYENPDVPYRLTLSTVPDNGTEEREPDNNTTDGATPIALGRSIRGTIFPKKDVDYYRLDLSGRPVRTPIKAIVTGILKVDISLRLNRQEESGKLTLVQTSDHAKGEAPEIIRFSAEPGVYFLEVRDSRNREANFQDAYQLTVEEGD